MKIINQLTLRYLKQNKKRSILTILCIMVSVIMVSCVGIAFYSGQQFYKDYIERTVGDYHYQFVTDNQEFLNTLAKDSKIEEYYFSSTMPYYGDKQLESRTFLNMKRGDSLYFEKENYRSILEKGRLPQNTKEVAISSRYLKANHLQKTIGDTISFYNESEKTTETFKIVGIITEYSSQNYYKSSFSALSYIDCRQYYTVYIRDKDVSRNIFEHKKALETKLGEQSGMFNSSYLAVQNIFEDNSHSLFLTFYNLIAVIVIIIVFISIFIIYQAFNLSTNDRIQYLGMLSSVGATPKQKKRSVYFEGFVLSLIAIPLGLIVSFVGLGITFFFINHLEMIKSLNIQIHPQISLSYLLIVFIISLLTIFISLYLPARKISKISVIDALKKNDEIKVKSHKLKTSFLSHRFFNIYGQMAIKNYKRQGRRSRVIVLSLIISMTAFIGMFSFGKNMLTEMNRNNEFIHYDIESNFAYEKDYYNNLNQFLKQNDKVDNYYFMTNLIAYANIDSSYLDIPVSSSQDFRITLVGLSENKRKELFEDNDLKYNQNQVLVYNGTYINEEGKEYSQRFHKIDNQLIKEIYFGDIEYDENGNERINQKVKLKNFESLEFIKDNIFLNYLNINNEMEIFFIVPMDYIQQIDLKYTSIPIECRIFSTQHQELTKELENLNYSAYDYAQSVSENRQIFIIIQIFVYGFVCIMILFAMLNIINMMSASIDKRKRELGMMLSVGMSPKDISKMLFYESFIYGLKTLLYGIPICIGVEWIFYIQMSSDTVFVPSFMAYVIAFFVIMIVMFITFRVGLMKFRKQNIIETLKEDM
ncbi:MAG: ABC transporter permease [Coprobacillus cateniformis]|uniref:ABC transporter permease n=1 Tax=Longibaculum muris TaxID=1796628 RepID=UPI003AB42078|nr:ABC transporter permease [Coprobacillus cateniformis]